MRRDRIREVTAWANHHGISRSTFYSLLRGRDTDEGKIVMPNVDTLVRPAYAIGLPTHEVLYTLAPDTPGVPSDGKLAWRYVSAPAPAIEVSIRLAGWRRAPDPYEDREYGKVDVELRFAANRARRAFKISGDSMTFGTHPSHDGDIVLVDRKVKPRNTDSVIARLSSDSYVCKMLNDDRYGQLLQSRNVEHTNGTSSFEK